MSNVPPPPPPGPTPAPPAPPPAAAPTPPPAATATPTPPPTAMEPTPPTVADLTAVGPSNLKLFAAEIVGTFILIVIGPGTAILASEKMGTIGVAFAFGFAMLATAYSIGHVSGAHINPAVTLAFLLSKKLSLTKAVYYWVAQVIGGILGALLIFTLSRDGQDNTGIFASNGWGDKIGSTHGIWAAIFVEIFFTALFVFVVLSTTGHGYPAGFGGIAVGITLGMIHLATIPVDNTSVNPARSLATALFGGTDALSQLWVFIIFPLVGSVLGVLVWLLVHEERLEDTMFGNQRQMIAARDRAAGFTGQVEDRFRG